MIKLMDMFDDEADAPHYYDYLAATNRMMMNGVAKKTIHPSMPSNRSPGNLENK